MAVRTAAPASHSGFGAWHSRRQTVIFRLLLSAAIFVMPGSAPALAKTYSAERFDSVIRVLSGGDIEVTETVVFRFETGTFDHVFRDIPTRRTDGIDVKSAAMDGQTLPFGTGRGEVEVSTRSRVRVRWRFEPVSASSHTFVLTYVARGVVHQRDGADVLWWRALPTEHAYRIDSSSVIIEHAGERGGPPRLETHRIADAGLEPLDRATRVSAGGIGRNGWLEVRLPFQPGSLIARPPAWQQRQLRQAAMAPRWMAAAAFVFLAGLVLLFAVRQRYDVPTREKISGPVLDPPDQLSPALAGALAANGSVTLEHALAALCALAERREISITEEPKGPFGQRRFTLRRLRSGQALGPLEDILLAAAFGEKDRDVDTVPLSKARDRIAKRLRAFTAQVHLELAARGLLDDERQRVRQRYGRVSLALILMGAAGFAGGALLVREFGPWPLFLPGALVVAAVIGFIVQAATTPLSNEGIRLAERWRAFGRHLKQVAQSRVHTSSDAASSLLAIAVALGLASAWSKFIKQHPAGAPAWFNALSATDDGGFPAFVAAGGAGSSGGGGGAGGGAAGGGGSGAG
jgi:hypothetical protein